MSAAIFDTETTGVVEPEVIQLAYLGPLESPRDLHGHTVAQYFRPSKPISLGALAIVDYARFEPAIDIAAFGKTPKYRWEWTSTPYAPAPAHRWCVDLYDGDTNALADASTAFARAVRAA